MPKPGNAPCGGAGKGNRVKGETDEHHSEEEFVLPGWQRSTEADGCAFAWQNLFILDSWVVSL